jgi:hypothetical protein
VAVLVSIVLVDTVLTVVAMVPVMVVVPVPVVSVVVLAMVFVALAVVAMVPVMVVVVPVPVVFVVFAMVFVFSVVFAGAMAGPGAIVISIVAPVGVAVAGRLLWLRLSWGRLGGGRWLRGARIDGRLRRCGSRGTRSEGDALRRGRMWTPGLGQWRSRRCVLWRHLGLNGFMAEGGGRTQASECEVGRVRAEDACPENECRSRSRNEQAEWRRCGRETAGRHRGDTRCQRSGHPSARDGRERSYSESRGRTRRCARALSAVDLTEASAQLGHHDLKPERVKAPPTDRAALHCPCL